MYASLRAPFLAMALLTGFSGRTQFDAIPDSNATWMVSFWIGPGYPYEGYFYQYDAVSPDTVIAGDVFKKLLVTGNLGGVSYAGAVRDNGLGQVYYCDAGLSTPALLYDFDVLPDDTVFSTFSWWMEDMIVEEVDTIVINGTLRKRIGLTCAMTPGGVTAQWIQGIGGLGGFYFNNACGSVSGTGTLICMTENDTIQYGNNVGDVGACDIYLDATEHSAASQVLAMPNPSSGLFMLNTADPRAQVTVFDAQGREVMRTIGPVIDLRDRPAGIYSALLLTGRGVARALLVVER